MTKLYLIRHGATDLNLARPYRLQGRNLDPPLALMGVCQAQQTSDFLAAAPLAACYTSPLQRAMQTAAIVAQPHHLSPAPIDDLTECDVGRWEGLDWNTIRNTEPERCAAFHADPYRNAYPEGESFGDVHRRVKPVLDALLTKHEGETIVVVAHHVVNRTYLAGLLGISIRDAKKVSLANCGVSVVVREQEQIKVQTLNATFHLHVNGAA